MTTDADPTATKSDSATEEWRPGEDPQGTTTILTYEQGVHDSWNEVCEALGEAWFPSGGDPHEEMKDILRALVRERAQRTEETATVRDIARKTLAADYVVGETIGIVSMVQAIANKVQSLSDDLERAKSAAAVAKSTSETIQRDAERTRKRFAEEEKRLMNVIRGVMDAVEPSLRPTYLLDDGGPLEKLVGLLVHLRAVALESRADGERYAARLEGEIRGQVSRWRPQAPGSPVVEAVREVVNDALSITRAQNDMSDHARVERAYQRLKAMPVEALPFCDAQPVYTYALKMLDDLRAGTEATTPVDWTDWVIFGGAMGDGELYDLHASLEGDANRAKKKRKVRKFRHLAKGVWMALEAVQDEQEARVKLGRRLIAKGMVR